ncbi:hypothetical protein ICN48_06380 [Polynucleobacter sp. JS-Safj-400b-B2]|uniref:hypothetical protein n=1 Tax=Polynucleobacter sp. JS-Safj-400b-B2 TaxID=2576921 RepID=UPI001C0E0892|nr:hypothetical protein [Polynucleobacter sp. JS-Safj-400b-B2]MBU3625859.1 hypothetical protein [Polynucleobacter sp. JS-Safj-400b-B2]
MTIKISHRSKNIDDVIGEKILTILDGWAGKLTWDLLISAIEKRTLQRYTRQALYAHRRIRAAYEIAKARLPLKVAGNKKLYSFEEVIESERNQLLKAENVRLKSEIQEWQERYNRWVYNAYIKGVSEDLLDAPLSKIRE